MRLINTRTLRLEEFFASKVPEYCILSHTWETEEVSLQQWLQWESGDPTTKATLEKLKGFAKIRKFCEMALAAGHQYGWVDTNCIDKTSSADLGESINSMFAWYSGAKMCYAYFSDLDPGAELDNCRWLTRGWTLQELLAPAEVIFFDCNWDEAGSKKTRGAELSKATGISEEYLSDSEAFRHASVARRMSWASRRSTTRIEDEAYSLLGLFDVNMPLLYGEGHRAFQRLQEHILATSVDMTIFAWDWASESDVASVYRQSLSPLAPTTRCFERCGDIWMTEIPSDQAWESLAMTVSNVGLSMRGVVLQSTSPFLRFLMLPCIDDYGIFVCVPFFRESAKDLWKRYPGAVFDLELAPHRWEELVDSATGKMVTGRWPDWNVSDGLPPAVECLAPAQDVMVFLKMTKEHAVPEFTNLSVDSRRPPRAQKGPGLVLERKAGEFLDYALVGLTIPRVTKRGHPWRGILVVFWRRGRSYRDYSVRLHEPDVAWPRNGEVNKMELQRIIEKEREAALQERMQLTSKLDQVQLEVERPYRARDRPSFIPAYLSFFPTSSGYESFGYQHNNDERLGFLSGD